MNPTTLRSRSYPLGGSVYEGPERGCSGGSLCPNGYADRGFVVCGRFKCPDCAARLGWAVGATFAEQCEHFAREQWGRPTADESLRFIVVTGDDGGACHYSVTHDSDSASRHLSQLFELWSRGDGSRGVYSADYVTRTVLPNGNRALLAQWLDYRGRVTDYRYAVEIVAVESWPQREDFTTEVPERYADRLAPVGQWWHLPWPKVADR